MSGWGCPHEVNGRCARVNDLPCEPGMKGCVLFGRFVWADQSKNRPAGGRGRPEALPEKDDVRKPAEDATETCLDSSVPAGRKPA